MPARSPVSQWRTTVQPPDSATATYDSSAASATPLAKSSPSRTVVVVPSRSRRSNRPDFVAMTMSLRQFSSPYDVDESENQTVPSDAIAALLQKTMRTPSTLSATVSTPPERVSTRSSPR